MLRCLELAQLGAGSVAPNPMVGCVIVHKNRIIGEGYTSPYGGPHAEVNAINSVADASLLKKATLYVSLEPCAHYGKTPPCVNLIIDKDLKEVVIACLDPFAKVNGLGVKRLLEAGINVNIGVLGQEAKELNRRFFLFHQQKRPYIILKWAETADGFVDRIRPDASVPALKITCEAANILVHKWRAEEAAIMVGKNTVLLDDPSLTTRKYAGKNPIRILLDGRLETPAMAKIFNGEAETILFYESTRSETRNSELGTRNSELGTRNSKLQAVSIDSIRDLKSILTELHARNIQSVIVEGGPMLHASFYNAGLWDEVRRFVSPIKADNGVKALQLNQTPETDTQIGDDHLFIYRNR